MKISTMAIGAAAAAYLLMRGGTNQLTPANAASIAAKLDRGELLPIGFVLNAADGNMWTVVGHDRAGQAAAMIIETPGPGGSKELATRRTLDPYTLLRSIRADSLLVDL